MPPVAGASWEDWYRWFLCELYKKIGGDCKDLVGDDASRASVFVEFVADNGVPVFASPAEQAECLALLKQLQAHLLLLGNDLPFATNHDLSDTIDKLIEELDK